MLCSRPAAAAAAARALTARPAEGSGAGQSRPRVVFLGSPECVCSVLEKLAEAGGAEGAFDLCGVVTQPPKNVTRKGKMSLEKTAIHRRAEELGIRQLWTPEKAKDEQFLSELEALAPDICITAAYGQYLPKRFLAAPRLGTLNLHPSLLPRWRGASPVQRALVAGDVETGITILYTVSKMDAGPIALQRTIPLLGNETSEHLLDYLFRWGADLLVNEVLPTVFPGEVSQEIASQQDEALVTHAGLIAKSEGMLWPHNETALQMRDKVRGFFGWPGTTLPVAMSGAEEDAPVGLRVKVSEAEVVRFADLQLGDLAGSDRPVEELLYVPEREGSFPAVGIRPATDPDHVLLLRSFLVPSMPATFAKAFHQKWMSAQPARWMGPEEEAERFADTGGMLRSRNKDGDGPKTKKWPKKGKK